MYAVTLAVAALAGGAVVTRLAMRRIALGHIILLAVAGCIGWLTLMRAWEPAMYPEPLARLITAIVGTGWFLLIQDAVRSRRDD